MTTSVAIVTGASSGIGRAAALRLARDFSAIVLVARSGERLREAAQEIERRGSTPLALELDLAAPDAADEIVKATLDRFGRIDGWSMSQAQCPGSICSR
ncbi:NAD(P)-dependent dehydrogenase (short-subunit alcohol dehydrogenase family) [Bradyrhizobium sp. USDA 4506]